MISTLVEKLENGVWRRIYHSDKHIQQQGEKYLSNFKTQKNLINNPILNQQILKASLYLIEDKLWPQVIKRLNYILHRIQKRTAYLILVWFSTKAGKVDLYFDA